MSAGRFIRLKIDSSTVSDSANTWISLSQNFVFEDQVKTSTHTTDCYLYSGVMPEEKTRTFTTDSLMLQGTSIATSYSVLSYDFTGADGDAIDSSKFHVNAGTILIQSNQGQVSASASDVIMTGASTITYETGLSIQATFDSASLSDASTWCEVGFQDASSTGQNKNIVKIAYNNRILSLYTTDESGSSAVVYQYSSGLPRAFPKTIKFKWTDKHRVTVYHNNTTLTASVTMSTSLTDYLVPYVEMYNVTNNSSVTIDNVEVRKESNCTWPKYGKGPLYGGDQAWEGGGVQDGCIVKVGTTYYRFYNGGITLGAPTPVSIGYMTASESDFPYVWTKYESNPVVSPPAGWGFVSSPKVIQLQDNSWRMYTSCYDGTYSRALVWSTSDVNFPIGWTIGNSGNPIFSENAGQWDGAQIQCHAYIPPWISGDTIIGIFIMEVRTMF